MSHRTEQTTRFTLEIDLAQVSADRAEELARILRYWAGTLKHYDLNAAHTEALMDSEYQEVGTWTLA